MPESTGTEIYVKFVDRNDGRHGLFEGQKVIGINPNGNGKVVKLSDFRLLIDKENEFIFSLDDDSGTCYVLGKTYGNSKDEECCNNRIKRFYGVTAFSPDISKEYKSRCMGIVENYFEFRKIPYKEIVLCNPGMIAANGQKENWYAVTQLMLDLF
ncbi:MAG: hypothetical protein NT129_05705 [Candidatus Aenigmarchaeota archaeon]|nr:hypothetical protein [Candidatus Aenigmarchaeota archaeon]